MQVEGAHVGERGDLVDDDAQSFSVVVGVVMVGAKLGVEPGRVVPIGRNEVTDDVSLARHQLDPLDHVHDEVGGCRLEDGALGARLVGHDEISLVPGEFAPTVPLASGCLDDLDEPADET